MNKMLARASLGLLIPLASIWALAGPDGRFVDPLDQPALKSVHASKRPLRAIARAGNRLVSVGVYGSIMLSDDEGRNWRQAAVPVSSDLNAVTFVDERRGWAVGHDGVILHSADGGEHWKLQADGRQLEALMTDYYTRRHGRPETARLLEDIAAMMQPGPASFYMDVAFENAQRGVVIGKFGLILGTEDGGRTWIPLIEHIPNPDFFHLSGARHIAGRTWIVGEKGHVWVRDDGQTLFRSADVDYIGSLFGIVGEQHFVLAYGMRGKAFRSSDGGSSWQEVDTGVTGGISDGAVAPDGVVLATQNGQLLVGDRQGRQFKPLAAVRPTMFSAVAVLPTGRLVLAGLNGIRVQ